MTDASTIEDEAVFNTRVGKLDRKGVRQYSDRLAKLCDKDGRFEIDCEQQLRELVAMTPTLHIITETTDGDDLDEDDENGQPLVRVFVTCNCWRYVNRSGYWLGDGEKTSDLVLVERIECAPAPTRNKNIKEDA